MHQIHAPQRLNRMGDIRNYLMEFGICSKRHLAFIEIIRVAAIFVIVFLHVVEFLGRQYSPLGLLADLSGRFFVPLLLMISGFLLGYKYYSQNNFQKKLQNDIQNSIEIDPQMGFEKIGFDRSRFLMRLRLRPQSFPKPFPIDMWVKCLT